MKLIEKSALEAKIDNILDYIDEHWDTDYAIGAKRFADKLQDAIDTLEVKEVDFWHKQSEEDIDDSIIGWSMHSFICLMKDGTTQKFTGIQDESYDGSICKHLDCVDDNYEWEYDDIIYWIEVPDIRVKKG